MSAYERDQQALRERLTALESVAVGTSGSLIDAHERIEALEHRCDNMLKMCAASDQSMLGRLEALEAALHPSQRWIPPQPNPEPIADVVHRTIERSGLLECKRQTTELMLALRRKENVDAAFLDQVLRGYISMLDYLIALPR